MNSKSIAIGVYKNPTIQKYLKEGVLTSSQINKLIVEEVMMDEALEDWQKKAISNIQNAINRKLKNDPVSFVHAAQLAKKGDPSGIRPDDAEFWNHLDDKQKKWVADRFLNATRTKKVLVAMTQALVDKKGAEPEKAAAVVVDATGLEGKVKPEELANAAGSEESPERNETYEKAKAWLQANAKAINKLSPQMGTHRGVMLRTAQRALGLEDGQPGFKEFENVVWQQLIDDGVLTDNPSLKTFKPHIQVVTGEEGEELGPEDEVTEEVEELVDQVEPRVEAEEEKTGQELGRDDVEKVARDEVSDVTPEKTPEEQEKIVQQATDIVTGEASPSNAAQSKEIYDSFDDNEKEALRLFQQFLNKNNLLQEKRNFKQLIGLDPKHILAFQKEIEGNQPATAGWASLLRKINDDNKQMKGVNWFLDQPAPEEDTPDDEAPGELDLAAAEAKYGKALRAFGDNYDLLLKLTAALMVPEPLQEGGLIELGKALKTAGVKGKLAKILKTYFSKEEQRTLNKLFTDPEMLKSYMKVYAAEKPEAGDPVEIITDNIEKEWIEDLSKAFPEFRKKFMKVATLKNQSVLFNNVWVPIRKIAGVFKHEAERLEKALSDEAPTEQLQEEEAPLPPTATNEPEPEDEGTQGLKNNVVEDARTLQRHLDTIEDALTIYSENYKKGTMGSVKSLKKYGEMSPKKLLYKMVKLAMNDANSLLGHIDGLIMSKGGTEPGNWQGTGPDDRVDVQDKEMEEGLKEQEQAEESRVEKIKKVRVAYDKVTVLTPVLLQTLTKVTSGETPDEKKPEEPPEQEVQAEAPEPAPTPTPRDPENKNKAIAITAKDKALEIYEAMAVIKEYFPLANPLKSEHGMDYAIEAFREVVNEFKEIIPQLINLGKEKNVTVNLLKEFKDKLERMKKKLIDIFGVRDTSKVAAFNQPGQEAADRGELETEIPPAAEVEWDDEYDDEEAPEAEEAQEFKTTKDLYIFLRKKVASKLVTRLKQIKEVDDLAVRAGKLKEEQPYQWYVDVFSKFWAYFMIYKTALKKGGDIEEARAHATQARGGGLKSDTQLSRFFRYLDGVDKNFTPLIDVFWGDYTNVSIKNPEAGTRINKVTILQKLMMKAQEELSPEALGYSLDAELEKRATPQMTGMLITTNPEELEPIEEPTEEPMKEPSPEVKEIAAEIEREHPEAAKSEEVATAAAEEKVEADESVPPEEKKSMVSKVTDALKGMFGEGDTYRDGTPKVREQLVKQLEPIIRAQLKRSKYG